VQAVKTVMGDQNPSNTIRLHAVSPPSLLVAASYTAKPTSSSGEGLASSSLDSRKRPPMPIHKSPLAALSLALAVASIPPASAGEIEQLTYNGKPSLVVCAVLHLCDIELQQGEVITGLQVGDRARWSITPAITGSGPNEVHHLVVRPYDVGLETSAVVATNRRTYHLQLRSDASRYMPRVQFTYPEEAQRKMEAKVASELHARQRGLIPETNQYLGDLDFQYRLNGSAQLKPLRVYNDHLKTTIELPPTALTEQPSLVITEAGRAGQKTMAYRREGSLLLVDGVFDSARLIYGKGGEKNTVAIDRLQKTGSGLEGAITSAPPLPPSKKPAPAAVVSAPAPSTPLVTPPVPAATSAPAPIATAAQVTQPAPRLAADVTPALPATAKAPSVTPAAPAPLPAFKPAAAAAPSRETWEAKKGSTLRKSVTSWAERAGWDLDWKAHDLDYPIEAPLRFEGSFEEAIAKLFPLYDQAERSFRVNGSRAQKLLIISENPMRNPQ
jgi:P-type conjugative transfer protein TrbG